MAPERKLLPGKRGRSKLQTTPLYPLPTSNYVNGNDLDDDDDDDEAESVDLIIPEMTSEEDLAVVSAKVELMKSCDTEGISLYHHLSELVTACLTSATQPDHVISHLEELSRDIKRERVLSSIPVRATTKVLYGETKAEWELFKTIGYQIPDVNPKRPVKMTSRGPGRERSIAGDKEGNSSKDSNQTVTQRDLIEVDEDLSEEDRKLKMLPNLMKECHMFNMAGYGLPASEYTRLALAMRELVLAYPLKSIRFWGKILGTRGNYYVVETKLLDDEYDNDDDDDDEDDDDDDNNNDKDNDKDVASDFHDDSDMDYDLDPCPKTTYKPPPVVPKEEPGTGVNAFVYFVCSQPGLPWRRLDDVMPRHIVTARQVTSLFTGDLDHVPATYPPFPGDESHYLRAQIARITSSTCISPIGYFKFDEDGEEEEEHTELTREACVLDDEFEGLSSRDLCDPGLTNWAHHINYILPQGRTTWFNPYNAPGGGEDEYDEEEEEERMDADEMEPEMPQPLLIPISEDVDVGPSPPWIARMTSQFVPEHSPVALTSVRWQGAVTVATDKGKTWANLYIGWGFKSLGENFDPATPPGPVLEFPTGPEVIEQEDPTPEEEAAMKAVMKEQEELMMDKEEDEEEEEEEEEEQEDEEAY